MKPYDQKIKVLILVLIGLILSFKLLVHHLEVTRNFQLSPSSCVLNEFVDCDAIARSQFSEIASLPTASFAFVYFMLLLVFSLVIDSLDAGVAASIMITTSVLAVIPTIFLATISLFIIKKICIDCSLLYLVNILLLIITLRSKDRQESFVCSIKTGLRSMVKVFSLTVFNKINIENRTKARLAITVFVLALAVGILLPDFLVLEVFIPRIKGAKLNEQVHGIIKSWQETRTVGIKLNEQDNYIKKDFIYGPVGAANVLVVFSDYQCPFCKEMAIVLSRIIEESKGELKLVIKDYPLDQSCNKILSRQMHQYACSLAIAARCAGKYGDHKFWEMHHALIEGYKVTETTIKIVAEKLGISGPDFETCLSDQNVISKVIEDVEEANGLGIAGTPTIFLNNKILKGITPENAKQVIWQALGYKN